MAEAFKIRLDVETKRRWQAAASEEGVSLAEWVRRRCEAGLPPKEIRVVTDVWLPGVFEVFPLKPTIPGVFENISPSNPPGGPTVHVDSSPPIDPEEVVASTIVCVPPSVGKWVPLPPEEPTVPPGTVEVEPMVESIPPRIPEEVKTPQFKINWGVPIPKPKPKAFNFSRCIQPQLLCQFRNMPLCGPCKEMNA